MEFNKKKIVVVAALLLCLLSSQIQSAEPTADDCLDNCSTGCVQMNSLEVGTGLILLDLSPRLSEPLASIFFASVDCLVRLEGLIGPGLLLLDRRR
ncbi:hypothetical protein SAY86_000809 [Trapa natans]|uniref:Uncharacterized protein n=1 Tax=Trapa natans TaxID=22666 RepID=A0AAN7RLT7_TRANT|nr:hypothetical protein SAY86_000809 [Trapa natans]